MNLDVFAALTEPFGQLSDHILVCVQQLSQQIRVTLFWLEVCYLMWWRTKWKSGIGNSSDYRRIFGQQIEGSDVKLVDGEDRGIASDQKGKGTESGDAMGDTDGQLLLQV